MKELYHLTDEQLIEYIRTKDQEAYSEIVFRYQEKLIRYALHLVSTDTKATDVVQDSFIKAFINLNSFDVKKEFSSWIYRIVHNEAINAVVKNKREISMPEDADFIDESNIIDDLGREEIKKMVNECFSNMPRLYYEPLFLFFIEERSYEEISDILRLPVGTIGTRINRAKILMKKICQTIQK